MCLKFEVVAMESVTI